MITDLGDDHRHTQDVTTAHDPRHHLKDYVVCATRLNEELDEIGADMIPEDELFQKISKEFKLSHYNNESAGGRDDSLSRFLQRVARVQFTHGVLYVRNGPASFTP